MESQHRGNRKAKSMEKREAKGKASTEEAKASMEEAKEPMESKNKRSEASGIHKNRKNKERCVVGVYNQSERQQGQERQEKQEDRSEVEAQ